jgi:hypothetical protein
MEKGKGKVNYLLLSQAAIYQRNRRLWLNFKNTAPMGSRDTPPRPWDTPWQIPLQGKGLWIYDKFMEWTDCGAVLSMDEMLDNITL